MRVRPKMVTKAIRPHRLLLVTFDLTGTTPGDRRYAQAEAALAAHGPVFRPVKQLRFVVTRSTSRRVKASLDQRLGRSTTILVTPIKSIPAWRIVGVEQRRQWRALVRALEEHGVEVDYLRPDLEGSA